MEILSTEEIYFKNLLQELKNSKKEPLERFIQKQILITNNSKDFLTTRELYNEYNKWAEKNECPLSKYEGTFGKILSKFIKESKIWETNRKSSNKVKHIGIKLKE